MVIIGVDNPTAFAKKGDDLDNPGGVPAVVEHGKEKEASENSQNAWHRGAIIQIPSEVVRRDLRVALFFPFRNDVIDGLVCSLPIIPYQRNRTIQVVVRLHSKND